MKAEILLSLLMIFSGTLFIGLGYFLGVQACKW